MPSHEPPSPVKRPSPTQRTSSAHSLSSSQKNTTQKGHRPHVVGGHRPHTRNPSYGKNLNKLQKLTAAHNEAGDGAVIGHDHQRKKSGNITPSTSPRVQNVKRNSSNISLTKNVSNLGTRKNHSSTALKRNGSAAQIRKSGLPPQAQTGKTNKGGPRGVGFEIGSSEEEEEAEWEDSSHSPETTRQNSAAATRTTSHDQLPPPDSNHKPPSPQHHHSPPESILRTPHRSTTLTKQAQHPHFRNPDLDTITSRLINYPRAKRAPPAMSSVSATATATNRGPRSDTSFTHLNHNDVSLPGSTLVNTPTHHPTSSSADGGVSRFIDGGTPDDGDSEPSSSFLPNFHPSQDPPSPGTPGSRRPKTPPPPRRSDLPSRTQQKLWLQRTAAMTSASPNGSSVSPSVEPMAMQIRSGSRGGRGSRGGGSDAKTTKRASDKAVAELDVVRRFRNPVVESLTRLENMEGGGRSRVQATNVQTKKANANGHATSGERRMGLSRSLEGRDQGKHARVKFQRQGSHDDIRIGRGEESGDDADDGGAGGEEDLIRRMWESREVAVGGEDS